MNLELHIPKETILSNADKEMLFHFLTHSEDVEINYDVTSKSISFYEVVQTEIDKEE